MQYNPSGLVLTPVLKAIKQLSQSIQNNNFDPLINPFTSIINNDSTLSAEENLAKQSLKQFFEILLNLFSVWPHLFLEQRVCSPDRSINLGDYIYVFLHQTQARFNNNKIYQKICSQNKECLLEYIKAISLHFIHIFSQSKQILYAKVRQLNSWAQKLKYTNKYLMFKVLKQLSIACYQDVKQLATLLQHFMSPHQFQSFVKWIIQKHELIELKLKLQIDQWKVKNETQKQTTQEFQVRLIKYLDSLKHKQNKLSFMDAIRDDGKRGLLIVEHFDTDLDEQYLVFSNQFGVFTVMNSALITHHWKSKSKMLDLGSIHQKQKNQLQKILIRKQEIISQMRTAPTSVTKIYMEGIENVGDSLGKCLANFKNYKSINSFIKDFSKKTAIAGSISYMVLKIPLLGGLMIVGGFSYTLYNILGNDYKNNKNKLADIGKLTIKTSASIGGGLVGAAIGQTLIPIPFVGAFIGGVFGGFLSTIGSQKAFSFLSNKRAESIYHKLKSSINADGSWDYSEELLNLFGLKLDYFQKSIPSSLSSYQQQRQKIWTTALCFCMLSYYQSKKDKIQMQEQLKKQTKHQIKQELDKIKENENENENQNDAAIESQFVSSDLDKTIIYMESKGFNLRQHLQVLTSLMMKLVQQQ